jgi:hypothetical protein
VTVAPKNNEPDIPLEDIPHHTDVPGKLTARPFIMFGFCVAQHTLLCKLIVPLSLKVISSDKTMNSRKDSLPSQV